MILTSKQIQETPMILLLLLSHLNLRTSAVYMFENRCENINEMKPAVSMSICHLFKFICIILISAVSAPIACKYNMSWALLYTLMLIVWNK